MPCMLLVMEQPEERRNRPAEQGRLAYERMLRFTEGLRGRGVLEASDALASDSAGVRVESRNGKRVVRDGPFAECKEPAVSLF